MEYLSIGIVFVTGFFLGFLYKRKNRKRVTNYSFIVDIREKNWEKKADEIFKILKSPKENYYSEPLIKEEKTLKSSEEEINGLFSELVSDQTTENNEPSVDDFLVLPEPSQNESSEIKVEQKVKSYLPLKNGSQNSSYFTMNDLENNKELNKGISNQRLSRNEETSIIQRFYSIVGEGYFFARGRLQKEGFNIHAIYINDNKKSPLNQYDERVIGVKIKDPNYDKENKMISIDARITEIVDVGGIDENNRIKFPVF